jgi:adenylate cyclase class 2
VTAAFEREIKLRFDSAESAREAILAAGGTPLRGRRLQEDCLLDTPDGLLRARQSILRVRMEAGKSRLTFKGPVQPSPMNLREEIETIVGDGHRMIQLLEQLGFAIWFRYQKYREEFAYSDVIAAVDETPLGTFVEIEGSERGITEMAEALGREPRDYVLESYRTLFVQHRADLGLADADMLFEHE